MEIQKSIKSLVDRFSNKKAPVDYWQLAEVDCAFDNAFSSLSDEELSEYVRDALSWLDRHKLRDGRPLRTLAHRLWKEVPGVDGMTALTQAADAAVREAAKRLANQTLTNPIYR